MKSLILIAVLSAATAHAMTPEDCKRIQATVAKAVPAAGEVRLAPSVTDDGWCRVIDGPLGAGLEWQVTGPGDRFLFEMRQDGFELDELGPFDVTGSVQALGAGALEIGPFRLQSGPEDAATFSAAFGAGDGAEAVEVETLGLSRAALQVSGAGGLVDDVLAWAFRQDLAAARSSFIAARDQRAEMLTWLDDEARALIDADSATAFEAMVEAYPRARGTGRIAIREDQPIVVGRLLSSLLFGTAFSRSEAAALIEEAGLRFTWQPE